MKTTFPSLASLLLACWGCAALAQGPPAPAAASGRGAAADETLRAAIAALERYDSIVAKVRQRAELHGKEVVGSGTYEQLPARYNLVRLEMSLRVDDRQSTLLQICDGKQLWTHRDVWGETKLACLDVQRVLAAMQKKEGGSQRAAVEGLALGGLPRILRELERVFQFDSMQESRLGTLPVRVLRGRWKDDRLKTLLPDQADAISAGRAVDLSRLPSQVPDEVLLYLGRDDLFPYRVECRRNVPRIPAYPGEKPQAQVLFAQELYEVRVNSPVDPLRFVYIPGTARFTDETDAYLAGRGL